MNFLKKASLCILAVIFLWAFGFVWFIGSSLLMKPQRTNETTDAIVVLTGGDQRIETGLDLFAKGRARHLFITGVHPDVSRYKIKKMWTGETALPPCCLSLGHQATTTIENAQETRDWIYPEGYSSLRLVTANYHMHRAKLELSHALPKIEIILHPIKQPGLKITQSWFWRLMTTEYHKTLLRSFQLLFTWPLGIPKEAQA